MGYGLDGQGSIASKSKIFLFTACRPALELTQPPFQWVPGPLSPWLKQFGHEADHSSPFTVKVKNDGAIPALPHISSLHIA
jgi:hypothetical protein